MNFTMTWGDAAISLFLGVIAIALWTGSARVFEWARDIWRERSSASAATAVLVLEHEKAEFEHLLTSPEEYQRKTFGYVRDMLWLGFNTIGMFLFTILSALTLEFTRSRIDPRPESTYLGIGFGAFFLLCAYSSLIALAIEYRDMGRHLDPAKFLRNVNTKIARMKKRASR